MNFWIGIVFFCTAPNECYFFKPYQTYSTQQSCFKVVKEYAAKAEDSGAMLVQGTCLYIQAGKTVNGEKSISKP